MARIATSRDSGRPHELPCRLILAFRCGGTIALDSPIPQGFVNLPFVVSAVAVNPLILPGHLIQEWIDLAGVSGPTGAVQFGWLGQ